jgi:hypothetical protein
MLPSRQSLLSTFPGLLATDVIPSIRMAGRQRGSVSPQDRKGVVRVRQPVYTRPGSKKGELAMAFVQIIEFRTSKVAEIQKAGIEWEKATEGKRKAGRSILCEDRDNSGRYMLIVFFESYEAAMANSAMPETDALSRKMMTFAEGPPTFYNLNVIDDRE